MGKEETVVKNFRIFYKKKEDPTTAKSCKIEERHFDDFQSAVAYAEKEAEKAGHRVVMFAELSK